MANPIITKEMRPIYKSIILSFLLSSNLCYGQEPYQWVNSTENTITLDLNKKAALDGLIIKITGLGTRNITELTFDMSDPSLSNLTVPKKEKQIEGSIDLIINNYIESLPDTDFKKKLENIKKTNNLDITVKTDSEESMKFTVNVVPKVFTAAENNTEFNFTAPPIPNFSTSPIEANQNKIHRILLVDGTGNIQQNRGFQLLSFPKEDESELVSKKALPINKSLSIFAKNINFEGLKTIKFNLNGSEYTYNAGITDIMDRLKQDEGKSGESEISESTNQPKEDKKDSQAQLDKIKVYLNAVATEINDVNYLNIKDVKLLQSYKAQLRKSIEESKLNLDTEAFGYYFQIMNFQPEYINLTPFALTVPNADEVSVESTLKFDSDENEEKYTTGVFRTSRSLAVHVGSSLFVTGLKNNAVFTETIIINENEELRAKMDKKNQLSVGVGVNSGISYRTGTMFRPNFNLAFFVPFAEDITPFVGTGLGFSFTDKNVSLNLSGGLAFGKVNSINEQYRDRDLSTIADLTNTSLIQKVWKNEWYASIGIGFNIKSED